MPSQTTFRGSPAPEVQLGTGRIAGVHYVDCEALAAH